MATKNNKKDIKKNIIVFDFTEILEKLNEQEKQELILRAKLIKKNRSLWQKIKDWFKRKK